VTCNIDGAKISIDGISNPGWVTPHDPFPNISAATHTVRVSAAGYDDFVGSVTVLGGETYPLKVHLSVPTGEIDIATIPSGAEVLIDGKSYGPSPVQVTVTAGEHKYTIMRPGGGTYEKTFTMKDGGIINKTVDLGGASATMGIIVVNTIPPGASVVADGTACGAATPTNCRLSIGPHVLIISLAGYQKARQEIEVTADGNPPINIKLSPNQ
jgi:hypothetical protein